MKIRTFAVEQWMDEWETRCDWNLAETCIESLTIKQLFDLTGTPDALLEEMLPIQLTYGSIAGSDRLRDNIAALYARQSRDNIVIAHGAVGANHLVYLTLVEPGDRVVSVLPTYQQHYSIPESFGAEVRPVWLKEERGFLPDLEEIKELVGGDAKLIVINNPNNPTGALMDASFLEQIAQIAADCSAWVLSDEVYRGTDHAGDGTTASIADIYEHGISTSSMSKAFSLAGLRLGWIAGSVDLIHAIAIQRDYNTISVSIIDDLLAAVALEHRDEISRRNHDILRGNLQILDDWVASEPHISYIKPRSGTVALLKYDVDMPSYDLCVSLVKETGVLMTPGVAFDMEGYVRIGYTNNPDILREGLARVSEFLGTLN